MLKHKKLSFLSLGLFTSIAFAVHAAPQQQRVVVAPTCLSKNITATHKILSSNGNITLIETTDSGIHQLNTAKHKQKRVCGGFMDVTSEWNAFKTKNLSDNSATRFLTDYETHAKTALANTHRIYDVKYQAQVNNLLKQLNPQNMWNDLTTLTNFTNRNATSDYGVTAANWIKTQIETIAKSTGHNDVSVYFVETIGYKQPSVVAKFGKSTGPGIVIGGHMDTDSWSSSRQPGADDDGTGTVTVLETARTLLSSGMQFNKPIYFIWYAAEEKGLVGSKYVVADFKKKNIPVDAVIQFDMTGYANDNTMWLINDFVSPDLTKYLETLINTYVKQPVKYTKCGYACSDHASWNKGGFAASMPFESAFGEDNESIHSANDTMDKLSLNHMTDYAKLAVAFAVELAEPVA